MGMEVATINDIERMAQAVAKSKLFGVKTVDEALALMLISQAEGRHPVLAARDYDIIQGRPAKKSEAMLRDFLDSGGKVEWHTLDDKVAAATFSHPAGGTVRIDWTMARAVAAGLGGRDMWKKYPRQMLRSRTVSEGIRTVCPMATSGMYVPEEVQDIVREKDITPRAGADEHISPERQSEIKSLCDKVVEWLNSGSVADAAAEIDNSSLEADEKTFLWGMIDSKQRKSLKDEFRRQRDELTAKAQSDAIAKTKVDTQDLITDAQKKRLEARIGEVGVTRDSIKQYCFATFGKEHFADLTKDEYQTLDEALETMALASQA